MQTRPVGLGVALLAAGALFALGCGESTDGTGGEVRRGPIGKADRVGSCAGTSCDGPSAQGNCWCDEACATYGDCCDDRASVCGGEQFCLSDDACAVGQRCDTSVCRSNCPPGAICPAVCLGLCVDDPQPPPVSCETDTDCGPGAACECVQPPCPPGQACPEICQLQCRSITEPSPVACWQDSECGAGQYCDHNACLPPPGCGPGVVCPAVCYGACKAAE